ncbi:uncharacterized protein BX664DRAFT_317393 [Halteromyces radiatus]|uniref:uncharacterized protein n=1 Tax=Halteromyces radiatus TaxID=101107 RepID=UPI00221FC65C|nr:uncharacterized protein BX664DRAFT_317393 [Halteromyces radiatus]KAI8081516.1 hypothetical protein BX664DRAFT_317393 [Halteromyces radiatus]
MTSNVRSRDQMDKDDDNEHDLDTEFSLPRHLDPTGYVDFDRIQQTSMEEHLPVHNVGYRLLQKMGWKQGQGLGSLGQGRKEPIRIDMKQDGLGIGKAEQDQEYNESSTAQRKAMDSEKQLEETMEERQLRESKVIKIQEIQQELLQVKRAFYCELCDKQYNKVSEYDQHLQSYDHHHKKRFKDMKEQTKRSVIGQSDKERKREREKRREEKEMKRMQDAIMKKHAPSNPPPPPPPPPSDMDQDIPPPPPPSDNSEFGTPSPPPPPPPPPTTTTATTSSSSIGLQMNRNNILSPSTPSTSANKVSFGFGVKKKASGIRFGLQKKE